MKTIYLSIITLCSTLSLCAQETPGKLQEGKQCFTNAHLHLGTGDAIENGAFSMENGVFKEVVSNENSLKECTQTVDLKGQHVYPGFIAPNSTLGLVEIDAVRASRDHREVGKFNPHIRSIIAYNTESHVTATVRTNGVLLGQITPRGGYISGSSSIVQFDAWNWEDAVVRIDDGVHLNWPNRYSQLGWWAEPGPTKLNETYLKEVQELDAYFRKSKSYKGQPSDLRMMAMADLFRGNRTLYVHADGATEIRDLIDKTQEWGIEQVVLIGGYEADRVAEVLVGANIPVLLRRVHALPKGLDDDIHHPFKLPAALHAKEVKFAFQNAGDMEQMQTRNLSAYAGTAVAYGLPYEEGVRALTLNTAEILGIDDRYGSLEVGKSATFFISTGDALDMLTNQVTSAYIDGRPISMSNHQKRLYEKFTQKYNQP